ncbi:GntR family transcriptional regulator [Crateriforma conspicua]|uniref:HTH-type transcriptional repressor YtrA n=1 Tax=Crateriforma conspicua TaxID=2527996 RepID=A0A5C5Y7F5_9PLAN|nr:GntR family transcriptional regulator [Crateriforma conspicua]TWT71114.1 HTH-type transcriptional repressor YtrA [Crateriforma conspicua]
MLFHIDPSNGVAIYDQVVRQVKFAVADGVLREGEMAPSVRELSRQLTINPNTVARAYNQLQTDGVLESIRGTGLAVKKRATDRCRKERDAIVSARIGQAIDEALRSGLAVDQVRDLVEQALIQSNVSQPEAQS